MAEIVVVGGGFAGISASIRLAKLGHAVTLLEASDRLGGQLLPYERDGLVWPAGPQTLTVPATLRDLFRKSGRPVERVLDLQHVVPGRRHVFGYYDDDVPTRAPTPRGTVLDLPMGSRADQQEELDSVLGAGTGAAWNAWLNALAPSWDVLRTRAIDRAFSGPKDLDRQDRRTLRPRLTLARAVRRKLSDERLTAMVIDRGRLGGQQPRTTPAFVAVADVIERSFGRWRIDGGDAALLSALVQRLAERRVDVRLGSPALDVVLADGQVSGVLLDRSVLAADLVVWAAPAPPPTIGDPITALPVLRTARTLLVLGTDAVALPPETVVHHDPPLRIASDHTRADLRQAWTVEHSGDEDVLATLAKYGIDVREQVEARWDLSAVDLARRADGAAHGWQWSGWRTGVQHPGVGAPRAGLFRVGVNTHPGPSLEQVAMGTATLATGIGKA